MFCFVSPSRISPAKAYQNYLDHVASLLATSRGRELPTVIPNEVRTRLISDVVRQWRAPAGHTIDEPADRC